MGLYPPGHHARIIETALQPAPPYVSAALDLVDEAPVVCRARVHHADGVPISTSRSWYDWELAQDAPALLSAERIIEGSTAYLARCLDRRVGVYRHEVMAGIISYPEADLLLLLDPGSPIIIRETRVLDDEGNVIEFGESCVVPSRKITLETTEQVVS